MWSGRLVSCYDISNSIFASLLFKTVFVNSWILSIIVSLPFYIGRLFSFAVLLFTWFSYTLFCFVLLCNCTKCAISSCDIIMRRNKSPYFKSSLQCCSNFKLLYRGCWNQKQVSQARISNCFPQYSMGCNYLPMAEIPASGNKVLTWRHCSGSLLAQTMACQLFGAKHWIHANCQLEHCLTSVKFETK